MKGPEQRLWIRARPKIAAAGIRAWRIENSLDAGMADVFAIAEGIVTPIELKATKAAPVRESTPLLGEARGLNREQRAWHREWQANGGRSLILVGVGSFQAFTVNGRPADEINGWPYNDLVLMAEAVDWNGFLKRLKTP